MDKDPRSIKCMPREHHSVILQLMKNARFTTLKVEQREAWPGSSEQSPVIHWRRSWGPKQTAEGAASMGTVGSHNQRDPQRQLSADVNQDLVKLCFPREQALSKFMFCLIAYFKGTNESGI